MKIRYLSFLGLLGLALFACQNQTPEPISPDTFPTTVPSVTPAPIPEATVTAAATDVPGIATLTPLITADTQFGYTNQRADGNRFVAGQGDLPGATPLDIPLMSEPAWVVAVPLAEGTMWGVALANGRTQAFQVVGDQVTEIEPSPRRLGNVPPLLYMNGDQPTFLAPPTAWQERNHPVWLNALGEMAFANESGKLFLVGHDVRDLGRLLDVTVLSDGRILTDGQSRLLFLSSPTTRYGHGVLGDAIEAASITLIETQPEALIELTILIPEPRVVEGIAPIWTDWDGDGRREIIVTLSDADDGAQIVMFDESGNQIAAGPAIGQGLRWRHQIAVAPFGPDGEMELASVLTPHIGGVVEFYQWQKDRRQGLQIVARLSGYTSHVIGSRNLDMAAAGDFDGDGRIELLLPNQQLTELGGIRRTADGAEAAWTVPLDGRLATNIGAVTMGDGRIAVGVGLEGSVLRIFSE